MNYSEIQKSTQEEVSRIAREYFQELEEELRELAFRRKEISDLLKIAKFKNIL